MPPPKQQNIQMQSNNLMQSNIPIQSSVPMQSNIPDNFNTNIANPPNPSSFQPLSSADPSNPNCDVPSFYTDIVTSQWPQKHILFLFVYSIKCLFIF